MAANVATPPAPPPLPTIPAIPARRPANDAFMPAAKRARGTGRPSTDCDVLYGPVDPNGDARIIANAAMEVVDHLAPGDVRNAIFANGRPGIISIRFREYSKALVFITAIQSSPPIPGQHAQFADATNIATLSNAISIIQGTPVASTSAAATANPIDIIRGATYGNQAPW